MLDLLGIESLRIFFRFYLRLSHRAFNLIRTHAIVRLLWSYSDKCSSQISTVHFCTQCSTGTSDSTKFKKDAPINLHSNQIAFQSSPKRPALRSALCLQFETLKQSYDSTSLFSCRVPSLPIPSYDSPLSAF